MDPAPKAELLRALGRLVRGLSALFWGLPITLLVCFHTARAEMLRSYHILPPLAATGLLAFGLWQLGDFQRQERIWRSSLDRARILALINFGLSPFLFWWNKMPGNAFFSITVLVMCICGLLFLASLNITLQRLGAMLPDEALRIETRQFTSLNLNLIFVTFILGLLYIGLAQAHRLPLWLGFLAQILDRGFWFLILLVLMPLAMTMALIWKTKEVILDNVFSAEP